MTEKPCPECRGTGGRTVMSGSFAYGWVETKVLCRECQGTGKARP